MHRGAPRAARRSRREAAANPSGCCRADNDGNITNGLNPDGGVDINDQLAFLALFEIGDPRGDLADVNGFTVPDAACDINDLLYFLNNFESGFSVTPEPVRFGWRGYLWDGRLNVHHVRHRVFDPKLMTWLQPDPLGTIDGPNIYAYAGWDPFNKIDPFGLAADESCSCASGGGGGGGGEGSGGSANPNDPFTQAGLDDLDANTRAGRGPRNDQSAVLAMQTQVFFENAGQTIADAANPRTYAQAAHDLINAGARRAERAIRDPVGAVMDDMRAVGAAVSAVYNFDWDSLSPEEQARLGGRAAGNLLVVGVTAGAGSAASASRGAVGSAASASRRASGSAASASRGAAGEYAVVVSGGRGASKTLRSNPPVVQLVRVTAGTDVYPTMSHPKRDMTWLGHAEDIEGLNAAQIQERLTIEKSDVYTVHVFPEGYIPDGLNNPIVQPDGYPEWVPGGRTKGGAREYQAPNGPWPDGVKRYIVGPNGRVECKQ